MCIEVVWDKQKQQAWLDQQPECFTVYKVVQQVKDEQNRVRIRPPALPNCLAENHSTQYYRKKNDQRAIRLEPLSIPMEGNDQKRRSVLPHYHFYVNRDSALCSFLNGPNCLVLKCSVPKNDITTVGYQNGKITTIITKYFEFVEGDQYFQQDTPRKTAGKRTCA